MKLLTQISNVFTRATEGVKNMADLDVDQQYAEMMKHLEREQMAEDDRLRKQYPAGWFLMTSRNGSHELAHWCPNCKTLSQGKTFIHNCRTVAEVNGVVKVTPVSKVEKRPEGWRLAFLPKSRPVIFV